MHLVNKLKRRSALGAGILYTVATWLLMQVSETAFPRIGLPGSAVTLVIVLFVNEQDGAKVIL